MGLDMYLYASDYTNSYRKEIVYPERLKSLANRNLKRNLLSTETKYQIGYWRKFNALHNYIVKHYANGEDNCEDIWLSSEDLEQILKVCEEVLKDLETCPYTENVIETLLQGKSTYKVYDSEVAKLLLPTSDGFFFGSQEYDEWYKNDLKYTVDLLKETLKICDEYEIFYRASW